MKDGQTKENETDKTAVISEEETNASKGKSTLLSTIQEHLSTIHYAGAISWNYTIFFTGKLLLVFNI